jgi:hypothetical protein
VSAEASAAPALLALCARLVVPSEVRGRLLEMAARVERWDDLVQTAEQHGLGPLMYCHYRNGLIPLPSRVASQVRALYLRHRRRNAVQLQALAEILDAFAANSVPTWVLKGPALMSLVYRDPALRPISDLDLLVRTKDANRAQRLLCQLGYAAPPADPGRFWRHHHLPPATRWQAGVLVQVELHRDALSADGKATLELSEQRESPMSVDIAGRQTWTLGPHEFLWHLCEHLVGALPCPMRLIGAADVVAYSLAFAERLDWNGVRRQYPVVVNTLLFLDAHARLPEALRHRLALDRDRNSHERTAWSWAWATSTPPAGHLDRLGNALNPPAWWLALRYGAQSGAADLLSARARHVPIALRAVRRRSRQLVDLVKR